MDINDQNFSDIKERAKEKVFKKHMRGYYPGKSGLKNPISNKTRLIGDKIFQVHCPSCHFFYMVIREEIDPDAGDIMQCPTCENLSYVPGSYRTKRRPYYDLPITGGCLVPLEQIREWFLSHPLVRQWTERGEHKNFTEYGGFFAYCSRCYYQLNQRQFNTMIGINARRRLYCCRNTSLIVILVEKGSPEESTFPNTVTVGA